MAVCPEWAFLPRAMVPDESRIFASAGHSQAFPLDPRVCGFPFCRIKPGVVTIDKIACPATRGGCRDNLQRHFYSPFIISACSAIFAETVSGSIVGQSKKGLYPTSRVYSAPRAPLVAFRLATGAEFGRINLDKFHVARVAHVAPNDKMPFLSAPLDILPNIGQVDLPAVALRKPVGVQHGGNILRHFMPRCPLAEFMGIWNAAWQPDHDLIIGAFLSHLYCFFLMARRTIKT